MLDWPKTAHLYIWLPKNFPVTGPPSETPAPPKVEGLELPLAA